MRFSKVLDIFLKEILDTLRDRRTLLIMFAFPVLFYPGLLIIMNELATSQQAKMAERTVRLALLGGAENPDLRNKLQADQQIEIVPTNHPFEDVKNGKLEYVLEMPAAAHKILQENKTASLKVHYDLSNDDAATNLDRLLDLLHSYNKEVLVQRLKEKSLSEEYVKPLDIQEVNVASKQKMGGYVIGKFLPMIMVLMVLFGTMYPAIDMTAGEKERGTLETILASPTSGTEIVLGKFLTVTVIALLTGLLNLGSMMGTFSFGIFRQVAEEVQVKIPLNSYFIMVVCLVPLAVFFSGLMMAAASFARSFKEAQNLLTPVYLVALMPSMISFIPGIQLEGFWITMPVANVVLLFKELMLGVFIPDHVLMVLLSVAFLASVSLFLAVKLFGREEVLFGEASSFGLTLKRSNLVAKPRPEPSEVIFLSLVALALVIYIAIPLQIWNLRSGLLLTELLIFLLLPLGFAFYMKLDLKETFSLRAPSYRFVVFTVLLFVGIQLCMGTIQYIQNLFFPMPQRLAGFIEKMIRASKDQSILAIFGLIALLPAICEEVMFRGVVLSGMLARSKPAVAIVVTSVLFAIFHLSLHRFLPVFLLSLGISFIVWKSGSIFVGMLLHLMNNSLAAFLINYPKYDILGLMAEKPSPVLFMMGSGIIAVTMLTLRKQSV